MGDEDFDTPESNRLELLEIVGDVIVQIMPLFAHSNKELYQRFQNISELDIKI